MVITLRGSFCPLRDEANLLTLADEFFWFVLLPNMLPFDVPDIVLVGWRDPSDCIGSKTFTSMAFQSLNTQGSRFLILVGTLREDPA